MFVGLSAGSNTLVFLFPEEDVIITENCRTTLPGFNIPRPGITWDITQRKNALPKRVSEVVL